ncbi:MAG: hypothetical protein JWP35_3526 [Caulobacter sp.]|nr:hypothetical protein [Caulobacter sp.]
MSYRDHFVQHLRLTVLRLLEVAPSCRANDSLLRDAAEGYGLSATRDQVRTEITWLNEQGLVTTEELGSLLLATLTSRGDDVAKGRATAPGVQRPSPGG